MRTTVLPLLLLLITGCSHLQSKVSIYDRRCLTDSAAQTAGLSEAVARITSNRTEDRYKQMLDNLKPDIQTHAQTLANIGSIQRGAEQDRMSNDLEKHAEKELTLAAESHAAGAATFFGTEELTDRKQRIAKLYDARVLIEKGDVALEKLVTELTKQSRDSKGKLLTKLDEAARKSLGGLQAYETAVQEKIDSLKIGVSTGGDPLISQIVYSPPDCWKGEFNKTFGGGTFGNTDIAIKVDEQKEYTLKGLRLDSTKVTQAFFKTLHQSIQFAAMAYGVPVTGQPSTSQEGITVDDDVLQADQHKTASDAAIRVSRLSTLAIMEAIIAQQKALKDDAEWKSAVSLIQTTYSTHKSNLVPQPGGGQQ